MRQMRQYKKECPTFGGHIMVFSFWGSYHSSLKYRPPAPESRVVDISLKMA